MTKGKKFALVIGILILGVIAILFPLFLNATKDSPEIEQTISQFLQYTSNNQFDESYDMFATEFKKENPKQIMRESFQLPESQYKLLE